LTLFRKGLAFVGRQNTIHLQETALVIEGHLLRFKLPIVDRFIQRAFCEWSMVTVPYSRILRHTYRRYLIVKVLCWLFVAALAPLLGYAHLVLRVDLYSVMMPGLLLFLVGLLFHLLFRPRHFLVFRGADGKRYVVCFRFTSRKQRQQFVGLL